MQKERKTVDVHVLEANYGYGDGWETVCCESTWKEAKTRKKEYIENAPEYAYRARTRRITKEKFETGEF